MLINKNIKTLLLTGFVALGASSCSSSFLDQEPSLYVTPEQLSKSAQWNPNILLGQTAGSAQLVFDAQTTANAHDDFGQKAFDIAFDVLSGDMEVSRTWGRLFRNVSLLEAHLSTNLEYTYRPWRLYYKIIFSANSTISLLGTDEYSQLPSTATASQKYYWGMSKALRAYAYFYLAQYYAKPYDEAANELVLPIYRLTTATAAPKSSLKDVYDLIIKDFTEGRQAIADSKIQRTAKSDMNDDVATAYLAYAYLQKGDYANAYTESMKLVNNSAYSLIPASDLTTNGFNNVSNPEFIWAIDITRDNTTSLLTYFSHVDVYTYGYAFVGSYKHINANLQAQIPATDLRGKWFSKGDSAVNDQGVKSLLPDGLPIRKFFSATNTAKVLGQDRTWLNDIHLMRLAEMYLVAAEAAARQGNDTQAKTLLKTLMAQRVNSADISAVNTEIDALSSADLLERIYYNWRVELWGEGRSLMTMKRFKKSVARTARSQYFVGESISYSDPRLTYQIPQRETSNNIAIRNQD